MDIFDLEKRITNPAGNVLFELEGQNALELYKKHLRSEQNQTMAIVSFYEDEFNKK